MAAFLMSGFWDSPATLVKCARVVADSIDEEASHRRYLR
jgi:hypothetical protein